MTDIPDIGKHYNQLTIQDLNTPVKTRRPFQFVRRCSAKLVVRCRCPAGVLFQVQRVCRIQPSLTDVRCLGKFIHDVLKTGTRKQASRLSRPADYQIDDIAYI